MGKLESLKALDRRGLNVHNYEVPKTEEELNELCRRYKNCTVRFDREKGHNDLPFVVLRDGEWDDKNTRDVFSLALRENCFLIVSDGLNYDKDMLYNMNVYFELNGDFRADVSELKIPLRLMYDYPKMGLAGNINGRWQRWDRFGYFCGDMTCIRKLLFKVYCTGIVHRYIECTAYEKNVGKLKDNIVYWQLC